MREALMALAAKHDVPWPTWDFQSDTVYSPVFSAALASHYLIAQGVPREEVYLVLSVVAEAATHASLMKTLTTWRELVETTDAIS
jgi:hypothetical protein